jgi:hypothetical protein
MDCSKCDEQKTWLHQFIFFVLWGELFYLLLCFLILGHWWVFVLLMLVCAAGLRVGWWEHKYFCEESA